MAHIPGPGSLSGQVVIVTGATSGLGLEAAAALGAAGATVVFAVRNQKKAEGVAAEIKKRVPDSKLVYPPEVPAVDMMNNQSIKQFCAGLTDKYPEIHILINNAGASRLPKGNTPEGIAPLTQANYLGPWLLTRLLEPQLVAGKARVVFVSSMTSRSCVITSPYKFLTSWWHSWYKHTKLAQVFHAFELQRRLGPLGVTACCMDPGGVRTAIWSSTVFSTPPIKQIIEETYAPAEDAAEIIVHAATVDWALEAEEGVPPEDDLRFYARGMGASPLVTCIDGAWSSWNPLSLARSMAWGTSAILHTALDYPLRHWSENKLCSTVQPVPANPQAYNRKLARHLWQLSAYFTGVPDADTPGAPLPAHMFSIRSTTPERESDAEHDAMEKDVHTPAAYNISIMPRHSHELPHTLDALKARKASAGGAAGSRRGAGIKGDDGADDARPYADRRGQTNHCGADFVVHAQRGSAAVASGRSSQQQQQQDGDLTPGHAAADEPAATSAVWQAAPQSGLEAADRGEVNNVQQRTPVAAARPPGSSAYNQDREWGSASGTPADASLPGPAESGAEAAGHELGLPTAPGCGDNATQGIVTMGGVVSRSELAAVADRVKQVTGLYDPTLSRSITGAAVRDALVTGQPLDPGMHPDAAALNRILSDMMARADSSGTGDDNSSFTPGRPGPGLRAPASTPATSFISPPTSARALSARGGGPTSRPLMNTDELGLPGAEQDATPVGDASGLGIPTPMDMSAADAGVQAPPATAAAAVSGTAGSTGPNPPKPSSTAATNFGAAAANESQGTASVATTTTTLATGSNKEAAATTAAPGTKGATAGGSSSSSSTATAAPRPAATRQGSGGSGTSKHKKKKK